VFTGEPSAFAREHFHAHHGQEGPLSMRWTVGVLAVLAAVGGFLQFAPFWHPLTTWLEPVARPFAEATNTQEAVASALAVVAGVGGIAVAWAIYATGRVKAPAAPKLLEQKLYFDELYDALFYRPAVLLARSLDRIVEQPLILGSAAVAARAFGFGSAELGRAQNGLVRSYALALVASVAILAVVFVSVR
jgi:NADH-quinone oxidoreductase subunit L